MTNCKCGATATYGYGRLKVCRKCYVAHARIDDSPARVPNDYDWSAEMSKRQLKP